MGCLVLLIIWLGLMIGLVLLPKIHTFIDTYLEAFPFGEEWDFLTVVGVLFPFAFLVLVLYGCFKWISKG